MCVDEPVGSFISFRPTRAQTDTRAATRTVAHLLHEAQRVPAKVHGTEVRHVDHHHALRDESTRAPREVREEEAAAGLHGLDVVGDHVTHVQRQRVLLQAVQVCAPWMGSWLPRVSHSDLYPSCHGFASRTEDAHTVNEDGVALAVPLVEGGGPALAVLLNLGPRQPPVLDHRLDVLVDPVRLRVAGSHLYVRSNHEKVSRARAQSTHRQPPTHRH